MSKFVKQLVTDHLKNRLQGVNDMFLVTMVGMDSVTNSKLRGELREKNIHICMIKNSLGRRACEGTPLAAAFENPVGMLALVWGSNDVVSLAKELVRATADKQYAQLVPKGGVVDGSPVSADDIKRVSKWPSREEQLSILLGQILAPGANLVSQLTSAGGALASQIEQLGESEADGDAAGNEPAGGEPAGGDAGGPAEGGAEVASAG